jgi:glycosyltransferase involved in cell wall biosynthesis
LSCTEIKNICFFIQPEKLMRNSPLIFVILLSISLWVHQLSSLRNNDLQNYEIEFVYATVSTPYRNANNYMAKLLGNGNTAQVDEIIIPCAGDIFLGLDFQDSIICAHSIFFAKIKQVGVTVLFVVYDLLPITLTAYFSLEVQKNYTSWLQVVSNASGAICISKIVADQFSSWIACHATKNMKYRVDWFHLGADIDASSPSKGTPDNAKAILSALAKSPSFLMVGTLEPRKGYVQTLTAFELLWADGIDVSLVLVGKQGWMVETLVDRLHHNPELGKHLFWLDGISDEYLEKIYASSTCLIAASEGEGFGLPLIEAAQHKLPIIARDIPVFKEVAGESAFYFTGMEPANIALAISNWLKLYANSEQPMSDNMPWLTWQESAQSLLAKILPKESNNLNHA